MEKYSSVREKICESVNLKNCNTVIQDVLIIRDSICFSLYILFLDKSEWTLADSKMIICLMRKQFD